MAHVLLKLINSKSLHSLRCPSRLFCLNLSSDLPTNQHQPSDLLLNSLKNASDTKSVLNLINQHSPLMTNKHIMQALRQIFTFQKYGNSHLSTKQILSDPNFRRLCQKLRYKAAASDVSDVIDALKIVSYVGVPADSQIIQVLLQLIRHNINNLSLKQILFLDFLLNHFRANTSPLVEALKIALPIVFEIHLPTKMDYRNVEQLAELLFYCTRNEISKESINKIVNGLMACNFDFDVKTAKSIIWSICDLDDDINLEPLMKKALESLMVNIDDLSFVDLETTLTKLCSRFTRRASYFYNETFYDLCGNYVVEHNLEFKDGIYILRKLARVGHHSKKLLDYLSEQINRNPDIIKSIDAVQLYSIVIAMCLTSYRPTNWDLMKTLISQSSEISPSDKKEIIWIRFASSLCLLDIYKVDVLTKALNDQFLLNLFRKRYRSDFEHYFTCYESIKVFKPELNCLLPKDFEPETLIRKYQFDFDYPLEDALIFGLGGEEYLKTDLYTKFGFRIDHLVVYKNGKQQSLKKTSFPDNLKFIEDFEFGPEYQLIVIKCLPSFNYTINTKELVGAVTRSIQILEKNENVKVVPISWDAWDNLEEFEKVPYLMQKINENLV